MHLCNAPDWFTQVRHASHATTGNVMDRGFSSLPTRCSLTGTDLHLHILKQKQRVRNGRARVSTTGSSKLAGLEDDEESRLRSITRSLRVSNFLYVVSETSSWNIIHIKQIHNNKTHVVSTSKFRSGLSPAFVKSNGQTESISYLAILVKYILAKKNVPVKTTWCWWACIVQYLLDNVFLSIEFFFTFESPPATSTYKSIRQLTLPLSSISPTAGGS